MWWEPTSEAEQRVAETVRSLASRLREGFALLPFLPQQAVLGIGTIRLAPHERAVLLVVDSRWDFTRPDPRRHTLFDPYWHEAPLDPYWYDRSWYETYPASRGPFSRRYLQFLRRPPRAIPYARVVPLMSYVVPLASAKTAAQLLTESVLPPETLLMLTDPPQPLLSRQVRLRSGSERGTFGISVELGTSGTPRAAYTTAGHVVDGISVQRPTRTLGPIRWSWTTEPVLLRLDCTTDRNAEGYDIAVVESRRPPTTAISLARAGAATPQTVDEDLRPGCAMFGAVSGVRNGFVFAAMKLMRNGPVWWHNCWTVVGEQGWMAKDGDSGAPVHLHGRGHVLGHLVAGVGSRIDGRYELGLVQDLTTQLAYLDQKFAMRLT